MKNSIYYLLLLTLVPYVSPGQKLQKADTEKIIQMALDFPLFQEHLNKNDVIEKDPVHFLNHAIRNNGVLPSDLKLTLSGIKVTFNSEKMGILGYDATDYTFTHFKLRKKKARVVYKHHPLWHTDYGTRTRTGYLFFLVELDFRKEKGKWVITDYKMEDVNFELESDKWISERYNRLVQLKGTTEN